MFNFFKNNPQKELNKKYLKTLKKAQDAQRSGDIKTYSELTAKAEKILAKIDGLN